MSEPVDTSASVSVLRNPHGPRAELCDFPNDRSVLKAMPVPDHRL